MSERTWDYIVVGAGSAGAIIAARLTEDPDCRVLLLEGGGSDRTAICRVPGMVSVIHTVPQVKKRFDWRHQHQPKDKGTTSKPTLQPRATRHVQGQLSVPRWCGTD